MTEFCENFTILMALVLCTPSSVSMHVLGVGDLHWTGPNGKVIIAESDSDNAAALLDFFFSVYTVEPDG